MNLTQGEAQKRLVAAGHGVLSTMHPDRGVDAVPVVYAAVGDLVGVPVDRIKPKSSTRLRRQVNLEADPRAALLIEHWDRDDWSKLWWVRAELRYESAEAPDHPAAKDLAASLVKNFPQYRDQSNQPFAAILVLRTASLTGWSAS